MPRFRGMSVFPVFSAQGTGDPVPVFVCQAWRLCWRCKSSASPDDGNRELKATALPASVTPTAPIAMAAPDWRRNVLAAKQQRSGDGRRSAYPPIGALPAAGSHARVAKSMLKRVSCGLGRPSPSLRVTGHMLAIRSL